MGFSFNKDQASRLAQWVKSLNRPDALEWKQREDHAEAQIHEILGQADFKGGEDLTPDQIDELFSLMRSFSNNRNLSNLLYRSCLKKFNTRLRDLMYGDAPLADRVDRMFELRGMGMQTVTQFLVSADSTQYPLVTGQTKAMLGLDVDQDQTAWEEAISRFGVKDPSRLHRITIELLTYFIVFEKIKSELNLEKFTQVNNLLWFGRVEEGEPESVDGGGRGYERRPTTIFVDGEEFHQCEYAREDEFEKEVEQNAKAIFGPNTTYYPLKRKLGSRICDALLYDRDAQRVIVIENEIASHDLYGHIVPQRPRPDSCGNCPRSLWAGV